MEVDWRVFSSIHVGQRATDIFDSFDTLQPKSANKAGSWHFGIWHRCSHLPCILGVKNQLHLLLIIWLPARKFISNWRKRHSLWFLASRSSINTCMADDSTSSLTTNLWQPYLNQRRGYRLLLLLVYKDRQFHCQLTTTNSVQANTGSYALSRLSSPVKDPP